MGYKRESENCGERQDALVVRRLPVEEVEGFKNQGMWGVSCGLSVTDGCDQADYL